MGAGGTSGSADGAAATADGGVVDDRPPRPAWNPPLPLGEPGWMSSVNPICETFQGDVLAFDVWADTSAVYVLFVTNCNTLVGNCFGTQGTSLQRNDGSGWKPFYQFPPGPVPRLAGFPGGPIVLTAVVNAQPGIYFLDNGTLTLSHALDDLTDVTVFGVRPGLAYARHGADILEYRDGTWATLATLAASPLGVWGNEDLVAVAGLNQTIVVERRGGTTFEALPAVPAGDYGAIWGFAADDLWAGNSVGQLVHYDGAAWQIVETGSHDKSGTGITALWGDGGSLYFTTFTEFGRADRQGASLLFARDAAAAGSDPFLSPMSLWGKSATEVFLTLSDEAFAHYACGSSFLVWFDGARFHQF